MRESQRPLHQRAGTFFRFVRQQRRQGSALAETLAAPDPAAHVLLTGGEANWTGTGHRVVRGDRFRVVASGYHWLAKPLRLAIEARATLFLRIGAGPVRKIVDHDWVYDAWDDGEVEVLTKSLSEFVDERGELVPGKRKAQGPGVSVQVTGTDAPATINSAPADWKYHWRLGEGRIYRQDDDAIRVATDGDVGILQTDVDIELTDQTELSWDWLVEQLPSTLPEDLAFTHDYLSIAVEFDNGRDLTYMWSSTLPEGHVFRCPLDYWCERETHWVLRSGEAALGRWHTEKRAVASDYRAALSDPLPKRIVRIWLIANSVFQRRPGAAQFANIAVS